MKYWVKWLARQEGLDRTILILTIGVLVFFWIAGERIQHIGKDGVRFGDDSKQIFIYYELESSYNDMYNDLIVELERSGVALKRLYLEAFRSYLHDSLDLPREIETSYISTYGYILDDMLQDGVKRITVSSVFRNHFPALEDTVAVNRHTTYVAKTCLQISQTDIERVWRESFPLLNRAKYNVYLSQLEIHHEAIKMKAESMKRMEILKMTILEALQNSYPELTADKVKRYWATKH